jgi:hypothetical protein
MAGNAPPHGHEPRSGANREASRGAAPRTGPPPNVQPPTTGTERHQATSLAQDGGRSAQVCLSRTCRDAAVSAETGAVADASAYAHPGSGFCPLMKCACGERG